MLANRKKRMGLAVSLVDKKKIKAKTFTVVVADLHVRERERERALGQTENTSPPRDARYKRRDGTFIDGPHLLSELYSHHHQFKIIYYNKKLFGNHYL